MWYLKIREILAGSCGKWYVHLKLLTFSRNSWHKMHRVLKNLRFFMKTKLFSSASKFAKRLSLYQRLYHNYSVWNFSSTSCQILSLYNTNIAYSNAQWCSVEEETENHTNTFTKIHGNSATINYSNH